MIISFNFVLIMLYLCYCEKRFLQSVCSKSLRSTLLIKTLYHVTLSITSDVHLNITLIFTMTHCKKKNEQGHGVLVILFVEDDVLITVK